MVCFFVILLITVTCALSCTSPSPATLTVFAAAGSKPALDEVCNLFEEKYDIAIEITYGGAGEALSQMELSRSGDVFVAPEQKFMETAANKGVIDPETVISIAGMIPVIGVPEGNPLNIKTLEDLAKPGVSVGVTRQETTLLGKYAPEIFEKSGLAAEITKNVVTEAARPDNLLTSLVMGQVDAAIIWNFYEVQAGDKIDVVYIAPEQLTGIGEMQAAVSSFTGDKGKAQKFVDFLRSSEGKEVFRKSGYIVDEEELKKYSK